MAEALLLVCHLLLSLALLAASLSHLLLAAVSHLAPAANSGHLRLLRHPLLRLLPVLLALPFPFLPVAPSTGILPLLLLPPLLLPLPLPFLPAGQLLPLRPLLLSLPLLLLARAAGLIAASFPSSDLQVHALSVAAAILLAAAAASLASALSPLRTAHHFLAETALACAGAVGGLWALQSVLNLYVDSCVPSGCHRLMDAAMAPATRCDVEEARLRAVAIMDLALSVHCVLVAAVAAGVYLGVSRWCGVDGGAGMAMGRRHNGVGAPYDALPTAMSTGAAIAEMEHLPMKGVVGKSVAQE
ncbi:hypothetical protein GUJ93_ZPchr0011g28587 [Zizania palustris]|uniref:Uncharacterized protein n=1 Tax=Zizania palustris TaxID=103762 RepID=A0A8J6BKS9_ZIZPA|nr:hypothetical protein GUJ93_ZPchr0011g28587 [Zizania palustris]